MANNYTSILKNLREEQNLTQEELALKAGISVRTIQRIESGVSPKGFTLKALSNALGADPKRFATTPPSQVIAVPDTASAISYSALPDYSIIKLINLIAVPFSILPPLNIIIPLLLSFLLKQKHPVINQIVSLQILYTIVAPIIFFCIVLMKLGKASVPIAMVVLIIINVFMVIRNTYALDKNQPLHYRLNFSFL